MIMCDVSRDKCHSSVITVRSRIYYDNSIVVIQVIVSDDSSVYFKD